MAAPMGKIVIENTEIMVISPQSPAGKVMLGRKTGESFILNGTAFRIESVA
jgi:transcription elongation GreA/GreB family factor